MISPSEKLTLYELNQMIRQTIETNFSIKYWVVAEISEIKESTSGHCYLELVQKDEQQETLKARARATIWSYTYRMLKPYFETSTGRPLSPGLKILVSVEVIFHELYGYSLNVGDIEPTFTIGDIEQKRRETIEKLISEGVFDMNKELVIPILPKRIAVISSPVAAGYQDFVSQIENNPYGYKVDYRLFSSVMQGDEAENSIITALNKIYSLHDTFDVVVIIRGGGSQVDLSCFDSYWLAAHIAQFPLPVISGIGHEKDTSVVDLVANTKLKTPTAVAEFIISKFLEAEEIANNLYSELQNTVKVIIDNSKAKLQSIKSLLSPVILQSTSNEMFKLLYKKQAFQNITSKNLISKKNRLQYFFTKSEVGYMNRLQQFRLKQANLPDRVKSSLVIFSIRRFTHLDKIESIITGVDPINVLNRGYSITTHNGKIVKDSNQVEHESMLHTRLKRGELLSTVIRKGLHE